MQLKKILLTAIIALATLSLSATITAVLNYDENSSTSVTSIHTCSTNEQPHFKITLWENGSRVTIPQNRVILLEWWKFNGSNSLWQFTLGNTDAGSKDAIFDFWLNDIAIQAQLPGFDIRTAENVSHTNRIDRNAGVFFFKVIIMDDALNILATHTTQTLQVDEGQKPILKVNDLYSQSNVYTLLSGCNSGNVVIKIHPSQTCDVDAFRINVYEIDGYGGHIGNYFARYLTSTELTNIVGSTGMTVNSITGDGLFGSSNGTLTMAANHHYAIQLIYQGQHCITTFESTISINYKTGTWDLVMSDNNPSDVQSDGYEPKNKWDNNVYSSPYLWNKLSTTANQSDGIHENPDYATPASGNSCKMMFKVTNIGCSTSLVNTPLRLFWTRARTDEIWAKEWKYDMSLGGNNVTSPILAHGNVAAGSEITLSSPTALNPYNASSSPFALPAINPGNTYTVPFSGTPSGVTWYPPDPADFDPLNGLMSNANTIPVICFLARINELGSALDPISWEPSGTSDKILPYVKNNNNVVTRNSWLVNTPQHFVINTGGGTTGWHYGYATAMVNNRELTPIRINLCVDLLPNAYTVGNFLDYGSIQIGTTSGLYSNWVTGGSLGNNISIDSATSLTITNGSHACLNNITLAPESQEQIGLRFNFPVNTLPSTIMHYDYQLSQHQLDSVIIDDSLAFDTIHGSNVVFLVDVPTVPDTLDSPAPAPLNLLNNINQKTSILIYPNPSKEYISIRINSNSARISELTLTNSNGEIIRTFKYTREGEIIEMINTSFLPTGIYLVKYINGNITETGKISVIH